jgi:oligopeptide/dipeptide ABC transporter ATP-binding protein
MCQRVAIAIALSCEPVLIIADEPTSSLDATVEAQILDLLEALREQFGMAILLISHDLTVISRLCEHTFVMYAGKVVEEGPTGQILNAPKHPYTQALVQCIPKVEHERHLPVPIWGDPPSLDRAWAHGCAFAPRCPKAVGACTQGPPPWRPVGPNHFHRCVVVSE